MKRFVLALVVSACASFAQEDDAGKVDKLGNSIAPLSEPCTFADAQMSCAKEFILQPYKVEENGKIAKRPWIYAITLEPPAKSYFWMQWDVTYLRTDNKWVSLGSLQYDPYNHSQTQVAVSSPLRIRVKLTVVVGKPPLEDSPVMINVVPARPKDFVPVN